MADRAVTTLPFTELEVADGNFDTSRTTIDRVVIHTMVGTWQAAASRFDTYGTQVSAHYGVKLDGGIIHWLEETSTAYHAGSYSMNQRSIGIEHEDGGDYNGVRPDVLYATSAKLVKDICDFYSIPIDREHIIKHSQVIPTGCPDALDIDRIVREAAALGNQQDIADGLRKERDTNWNLYQNELTTNAALTAQIEDLKKALDECKTQASTVTVQVPASSVVKPLVNNTASTQPVQASNITQNTETPLGQSNPLPQNVQNTSPSGPGGFTTWISRFFHSIFG